MKKALFTKATALCLIGLMTLSLVACGASKAPGGTMNLGMAMIGGSGESYTEIVENAFVNVSDTPDSYFSIDANTGSYPNLRSMINQGTVNIPKDAVRVEDAQLL